MAMLRTSEINTINESDKADLLTNDAWAIRSNYHTVLKTTPGAAIFGRDMLFDVPFLADWSKTGNTDKRNGQVYCQRKQWPCRLGLSARQ